MVDRIRTVLTNDKDFFDWWDENDGEQAGEIYGLDGGDHIEGDAGDDYIDGGAGDDFIDGGISGGEGEPGWDQLYGNVGEDALWGYGGNDYLDGGPDDDHLFGGNDHDSLVGGTGNDGLYGQGGNDYLVGGPGADKLNGNQGLTLGGSYIPGDNGFDTVSYLTSSTPVTVDLRFWANNLGTDAVGDSFTDIEGLEGSQFADDLRGDDTYRGAIANWIRGYGGDDYIYGREGGDTLEGGEGSDVLNGGPGADHLDGGNEADWASYYFNTQAVGADLLFPWLNTGDAAGDSYAWIENLQGGSNNDHLGGDQWPNLIQGDAGDDLIAGRAGDDFLYGEGGDDTLIGEFGADRLDGGGGANNYASYINAVEAVGADLLFPFLNFGLDAVGDTYFNIQHLVGSPHADHLGGDHNPNIIQGGDSADLLAGRGGNDQLYGDEGDDTLIGEGGSDYLNGGNGNDFASYVSAPAAVRVDFKFPALNTGDAYGDTYYAIENMAGSAYADNLWGDDYPNAIFGGASGDFLVGLGGDDALYGEDGIDSLFGSAGNDVLDGGANFDGMSGGAGDDTYYVDSASDIVSEITGEGNDLVFAGISYSLGNNVENLFLTGVGSINGTGNTLVNVIIGNAGNNVLDGGAGADLMFGSVGNNSYVADTSFDQMFEYSGEGTDWVYAGANFQLGGEVENLILTGDGNLNGFGNNQVNSIIGNSGNNVLDGGLGADNLTGGIGNDNYVVDNPFEMISENPGEGTDAVFAYTSFQLGLNLETLLLQGSSSINGAGNDLVNTLIGNAGNNVLNGDVGADTMIGGVGTDVYYVDNNFETITENPGEGVDTVYASISYQVGNNLEFLYLLGSAGINGFGNPVTNYIEGNSGDNGIDGDGGTDALWGKGGNDLFIFRTGQANGDILYDFVGNGAGIGDWMQFVGFGTIGGGATFTNVGGNQWQIHSGLDAHNEFITFDNGASVDPNDFIFA